ncbi:2OG-Fe(II) oxygenase [Mycena latifolia]|nr:2OG-Fe(II) oxygenase [Mycena latifolia]
MTRKQERALATNSPQPVRSTPRHRHGASSSRRTTPSRRRCNPISSPQRRPSSPSRKRRSSCDVHSGGVAWRGYMPLGGEGTHGRVDRKEGIYFGPEHADHPPTAIVEYIAEVTKAGTAVTAGLSLGLGLEATSRSVFCSRSRSHCFAASSTLPSNPMRVKKPMASASIAVRFPLACLNMLLADFGLLAILKQASAGLQVFVPMDLSNFDVPVLENAFVINVGDMLDQLTGGRLPSRAHRVVPPPPSAGPRYSFPFFFDFAWNAAMTPLDLSHLPPLTAEEAAEAQQRWQCGTFKKVEGQWWQYLAKKVKKVFPDLALPDFEANEAPSTRFTRSVFTTKVA